MTYALQPDKSNAEPEHLKTRVPREIAVIRGKRKWKVRVNYLRVDRRGERAIRLKLHPLALSSTNFALVSWSFMVPYTSLKRFRGVIA